MKATIAVFCCLVFTGLVVSAPAQQEQPKPPVSMTPLNAEQLAVYRAVLSSWMSREMNHINLAAHTEPLDTTSMGDAKGCGKGLKLEPASTLVHDFRPADLAQLGGDSISLIAPAQGAQQVKDNDPERTMGRGKSVDEAVENAFAHGLFTLSEIRFDQNHTHAIVSYSFVCGGLCGNGSTVVLEKTATGWHNAGNCGGWIS